MPVYQTRRSAESYGQAVGILLLDARAPLIPGDVGNAGSYNYPVRYSLVPGLTTLACLAGEPGFDDLVVEHAKALEAEGCRGISSDCGFMLQFQDRVAEAVDIPVALSSLLQLPFIARTIGPELTIGIITADSTSLSEELIARYRVGVPNPLAIYGMQDEPEFKRAIMEAGADGSPYGKLDSDMINAETVRIAETLVAEHPDTGAILLECSVLPPYAKAVQNATGLPVFDFIDIIDYMQSGTHQRRYHGTM